MYIFINTGDYTKSTVLETKMKYNFIWRFPKPVCYVDNISGCDAENKVPTDKLVIFSHHLERIYLTREGLKNKFRKLYFKL